MNNGKTLIHHRDDNSWQTQHRREVLQQKLMQDLLPVVKKILLGKSEKADLYSDTDNELWKLQPYSQEKQQQRDVLCTKFWDWFIDSSDNFAEYEQTEWKWKGTLLLRS